MGKWLFDILKDNTIVDNQTYQVNNCVLSNRRLTEPITLNKREYGWKHPFNDENAIWNFLNHTNREIQEILNSKVNNTLVLFNDGDYEHNSDDNFIDISGVNCMNFTLKTGNIIGYVKKGDYSLKISSRYGDKFLKYIISDADGFLEIENKGGTSKENGYEWLLIYLWKIKLKKSFRLGLPKNYITKIDRLNKAKGNIDVNEYFTGTNDGRYKCKYREHSYNNSATKLISATFNKIGNHEFLNDTTLIRNAFYTATEGIRDKRNELYKTAHFTNPFYSDYNAVIDLSKLILRDELSDFGEKSDSQAFLFDVSMLFEYFVRKLLKRNEFVLESKFEKRAEIPTGVNTYHRKLEPDIVFHHQNSTYVFDVKYKHFDFQYGVKREDLFQLHAYIGQYGNKHNIKGCGFIYPISQHKWGKLGFSEKESLISNELIIMGQSIPFHILFICIPPDSTTNFHDQFKINCDNFIRSLKEKIVM